MASLCEGGNEHPGSLKACKQTHIMYSVIRRSRVQLEKWISVLPSIRNMEPESRNNEHYISSRSYAHVVEEFRRNYPDVAVANNSTITRLIAGLGNVNQLQTRREPGADSSRT
ncbi:hypothetical protein ANN_26024, partial [Periplaneta americana]